MSEYNSSQNTATPENQAEQELLAIIAQEEDHIEQVIKPQTPIEKMSLEDMKLANPAYFDGIDPDDDVAIYKKYLEVKVDFQNNLATLNETPESKPKKIGNKELKIGIGITLALITAIAIYNIFGDHPHGPQNIINALTLAADQQFHPTIAQATETTTSTHSLTNTPPPTTSEILGTDIVPSPTLSTISTPESVSGGEPPRPANEFIKFIDPKIFDNDSQHAMHTDVFVLGGPNGNDTSIIRRPNEKGTNTLVGFQSPTNIFRFNPEKSRWETMKLPTEHNITSLTFINNAGKTSDGIQIIWDDGVGGSVTASRWEFWDPNQLNKDPTPAQKWEDAIHSAIQEEIIYYSQNSDHNLPVSAGPAVFHRE